jgi:hypothetical protein
MAAFFSFFCTRLGIELSSIDWLPPKWRQKLPI